jgi:hypothetical protein
MPINIYIDVSSLACPLIGGDEKAESDKVESYVKDLLFIKDNLKSKFVNFISSENLTLMLSESGLYPIFNDIKYLIESSGLDDFYDPRDVNRIFELLFRQMPFAQLPVTEMIEISNLTIQPELADWGSVQVKRNRESEFSKAAFATIARRAEVTQLRVFADFPKLTEDTREYVAKVSGTLEAIDGAADFEHAIRLPHTFAETFPLITRVANVFTNLDYVDEASRCLDPDEFAHILSLAIGQKSSQTQAMVRPWSVGEDFYRSLETLHLRNDLTALRALIVACVDAVLWANLGQTHRLRRNAGGNSGARTQGDATAWRRDVNYEFHLYYWEARGECELSAVVVHNDYSIPRCNIAKLAQ